MGGKIPLCQAAFWARCLCHIENFLFYGCKAAHACWKLCFHNNIPIFYPGLLPRGSDVSHQLFTPWSFWSACSKTCGVGFRVRRRSCINPTLFPTSGLCNGLSIQHQSCFDRICPGKKIIWLSLSANTNCRQTKLMERFSDRRAQFMNS